jgi:hypothetical protein
MEKIPNVFDASDMEPTSQYPTGSKIKILKEGDGIRTFLVKTPERFYIAAHSHGFSEQHIILSGEYWQDGTLFKAGSYRSFKPHELHGPFESDRSALILVIWHPYPGE